MSQLKIRRARIGTIYIYFLRNRINIQGVEDNSETEMFRY